ncbi:MAG: hypothetical protein A4E73_02560 [Syntrophaceae bacterium PtaU1.Bin231]|nr:MAG: hypothetical protein A4E73_02560 [Syntrophaceae bacterium PtaU1.Bin231]HOG18271.1 hypothetical protein [Syntrophales bacterium]
MDSWNDMEPYIVNVIGIAVAIAMILVFRRRKRAQEAWKSFALRHGFSHTPPGPASLFSSRSAIAFQDPGEVNGRLHALPIRLHVEIRGTGRNRSIHTIMSAEIPDLPAGLAIYHENTFLKITKFFGAQDIKTNDPRFDAAFVVKGEDPAGALLWLDAPRRDAILNILEKNADIDIRDGCLRFERDEIVADPEELEKALLSFEALAPHLRRR